MKKLLFLLLFMVVAVMGNAQVWRSAKADRPVTYGIQAGAFASQATNVYYSEYKVGWKVGATVDINVNKSFYVQTGLNLAQKNMSFGYLSTSLYPKPSLKHESYDASPLVVEVPVLASIRLHTNGKVKWNLHVGPYFSIGVGGSRDGIYSTLDTERDIKGEVFGDYIKRFNYGVNAAAGIEVSGFIAEIDYTRSLGNIAGTNIERIVDMQHEGIGLKIGYKF